MSKASSIPHSWSISGWPADIYPNSAGKARYLIRFHRDEMILAGALSRVGRDLIVFGEQYIKWLQKKAARVPGYEIAVNRNRRPRTGAEATPV